MHRRKKRQRRPQRRDGLLGRKGTFLRHVETHAAETPKAVRTLS